MIETRRHNIGRHRVAFPLPACLPQHCLRYGIAEVCILDLAEEILRLDIRHHHRRHHPVRNQFTARRALLVIFQELGQEVFQSHLVAPLDEVDDHHIHDIVREAFVLQSFCNGVEVAQSEKRLWCAQRWIEGREVAIAIQPQRISFQRAAREVDTKNVSA